MGWRGALRAIAAAQRQAERNAVRRRRQLERAQKDYARMQELDAAAHEVEMYENHLEQIRSVHRDCSAPINWQALQSAQEPGAPTRNAHHETAAPRLADEYQPGTFDKLFRRVAKRREELDRA